ncbi:aldehyde dehydrogenase family protein [Lysinibacillus sp. KCTC 33748]|uniref:aldehyde dehydrogenase family protein n=1 Tax=unclassified Lysinibacillus TaxID=2636778 RepID=UPI0009A6E78C|nr:MULTISPECIES: aldehyde dehydrogenase family protein [unclassified Lysinibacillus]OXS75526.1 aldehyde dehydrogenase family protein [Lysinibacillus sp. KCTC 33748]SKB54739.1 aldehyde dehydrogenase (NAD+) [Lysinibacillus sp. AC-3]
MTTIVREIREQFNPAKPSQCIGQVELLTIDETKEVIVATQEAFEGWKNTSSVIRGEILRVTADLLEKNIDKLAEIASSEMGKTKNEMLGEVKRGASILRYFAQEGMRAKGEVLPSANEAKLLYTMRVPLGVVAAITPWNFPVAIPLWKIAPALVYGNTVVWKPSIESALTGKMIGELFQQAGLPENVLNVVQGRGSKVGQVLLESPEVKAITFTGSNGVGQSILDTAGSTNKKIQLELGGKNAAIILADANINQAAKLTIEGAMKQTGQRCTATSRVYIEETVYDKVLEQLIEEAKKIEVGVTMGPVSSKGQYDSILSAIEKAKDEGAELVFGGNPTKGMLEGYYIDPTIFTNVTHEMSIAHEEIFGPVLAVIKVKDYEEAVRLSNDSNFGLSASIYTNNIPKAFDFINRSEVGLVQVNDETGGAEPQAPFGGVKNSSTGAREQGQAAKEFFTTFKTITIGTKSE